MATSIALRRRLPKRTRTVLDKLKKQKGQELTEEELIPHAENLSDPEYIRCQFSYLLDGINEIVMGTGEEQHPTQDLTSLETETTRQKNMDDLATAMNIPVKLILKQLNHARPPLANKLSQLFRCEYGPLHSILQIGEITLEWDNAGLVVPSMLPRLPGDLETQAAEQSVWRHKTRTLARALGAAVVKRDYEDKFNIMYTSMSEKVQLIDRLVDVIITYNCEKTYSVFRCNCQHFTQDALSALGYTDTIRFRGKMNDYFEQLKAGNLTVPEEFSTHKNLDDYVKKRLSQLTLPDMEYLLCQYFKHHLPSMEQAQDWYVDNWTCDVDSCQSDLLDSLVKDKSSFRASEGRFTETMQEELFGNLPQELQDKVTVQEQEKIMSKMKGGYRERVLYKLQQHPDRDLVNDEDIIDKLTEREKFRENFCTNIIEGVSETLVVETSTDFQKADKTDQEARDRASKRMNVFCNFPVRLLLYASKKRSSSLKAALQVGSYYFEWNKTSLIIPKRVEELTSTKPVLKVSVPQSGVWSSYVKGLQSQIEEALQRLEYDNLIQLQYQLVHKKDELLCALIDVIVKYNRCNAYNSLIKSNTNFIRDAQLALGIAQPNKDTTSVQEHLKKVKLAWKKQIAEKVKIETHRELDEYVQDSIRTDNINQEALNYFIGQYFTFHISGWGKEEPIIPWSCGTLNCMLPKVEELVDLCMW